MPGDLSAHPDLHAELSAVVGLGGVMEWMRRRGIELNRAEIVQQDEFALDFVLELAPERRTLVFGIT